MPTVLALIPMAGVVLFHNWWFYGHGLTTGYHLWGHQVEGDFSARFLTTQEVVGPGPSWPFLRTMLGLGEFYPVPVFLAAVWGVRMIWRDRSARLVRFGDRSPRGINEQVDFFRFELDTGGSKTHRDPKREHVDDLVRQRDEKVEEVLGPGHLG